jgi:DNA-binding transcriptional ArsR family regulator
MRLSESTAAAGTGHTEPPDGTRLAVAAEVFGLLADPVRVLLLWTLAHREAEVAQLAGACGVPRSEVSRHLAKLHLAGLVQIRRESGCDFYSLGDGRLRRLVLDGVHLAREVMDGAEGS